MIEIYDIIAKMKDFIQRDYNGAKEVLTQYPVLAEALLKGRLDMYSPLSKVLLLIH